MTNFVCLPTVDKATSETNTAEDWNLILDICDQVQVDSNLPKECLKYLMKRMNHSNPHVVLHSLTVSIRIVELSTRIIDYSQVTCFLSKPNYKSNLSSFLQLLDACVNNCGKRFHLEVCSREFESEFKRCLQKRVEPKVIEKMLSMIKKWAESEEFKKDPQLTLIPTLYRSLMKEYRFPTNSEQNGQSKHQTKLPTDPNVVTSNQEEVDIAKAIELSLKESGGSSPPVRKKTVGPSTNNSGITYRRQESNSGYPTFDSFSSVNSSSFSGVPSGKEPYQVRALYDFEAAEDNELTFKAGEVVVVLDDSDQNWWKGSNHRGEGLFPANFVTTDLTEPNESVPSSSQRKSVQFNDEVKVTLLEKEVSEPVSIDPEKVDRLVHLLHEADPTGDKPDSDELITLEEQCSQMTPLIDEELEKVDRKICALNGVNSQLVEAMNLYHSLMRESLAPGITPYSTPYQPGPQHSYPLADGSPAHYPPPTVMGYSHPGYGPPVDSIYGHHQPPHPPVMNQYTSYHTSYSAAPPTNSMNSPQCPSHQQQQQPQQLPYQQQHPPQPPAFASPTMDQNHPTASVAPNM
jgi:signal transducing adaptor molecule